jgi:hypothetical protein
MVEDIDKLAVGDMLAAMNSPTLPCAKIVAVSRDSATLEWLHGFGQPPKECTEDVQLAVPLRSGVRGRGRDAGGSVRELDGTLRGPEAELLGVQALAEGQPSDQHGCAGFEASAPAGPSHEPCPAGGPDAEAAVRRRRDDILGQIFG